MTARPGQLPCRGAAVRDLDLPLPPPGTSPLARSARARMAAIRGGRPLKRWRYLAAFGPQLILCAGDARIGPLPQRWWALARPGRPLIGATSAARAGMRLSEDEHGGVRLAIDGPGVRLELAVPAGGAAPADGAEEPESVEVASPSGRTGWIWTRKRGGLPATGRVVIEGVRSELALRAMIDDSAGYHERHTAWRWSTGVGRAQSGERVGWNLVHGVHDAPQVGEGTVWVDGRAIETGPATFEPDLARVTFDDGGELRFRPWAVREHRTNLLLVRSRYRQPFGVFEGRLPGGQRLTEGYGVMEEHDVRW